MQIWKGETGKGAVDGRERNEDLYLNPTRRESFDSGFSQVLPGRWGYSVPQPTHRASQCSHDPGNQNQKPEQHNHWHWLFVSLHGREGEETSSSTTLGCPEPLHSPVGWR
jgi:hypothetical protein